MQDAAAHELQNRSHTLDQLAGSGRGTIHEGQRGGLSANHPTRHGRVNEMALPSAMDCLSNLARDTRIDGGAVDEEALDSRMWEGGLKD